MKSGLQPDPERQGLGVADQARIGLVPYVAGTGEVRAVAGTVPVGGCAHMQYGVGRRHGGQNDRHDDDPDGRRTVSTQARKPLKNVP